MNRKKFVGGLALTMLGAMWVGWLTFGAAARVAARPADVWGAVFFLLIMSSPGVAAAVWGARLIVAASAPPSSPPLERFKFTPQMAERVLLISRPGCELLHLLEREPKIAAVILEGAWLQKPYRRIVEEIFQIADHGDVKTTGMAIAAIDQARELYSEL